MCTSNLTIFASPVVQVLASVSQTLVTLTLCSTIVHIIPDCRTAEDYFGTELHGRQSEQQPDTVVLPHSYGFESTSLALWRLHTPCFVTLIDISPLLGNEKDSTNSSFFSAFGSNPRSNEVYLFIAESPTTETRVSSSPGENFLKFGRLTCRILNAFFVLSTPGSVTVYQLSANGNNMLGVTTAVLHTSTGGSGDTWKQRQRGINYDGAELLVLTCLDCDKGFRYYGRNRNFDNFIAATAYEFCQVINASMNYELWRDKKDNDAERELLMGTSAMQFSLEVPRASKLAVLYYSNALLQESVGFVTRLPMRIKQNGLTRLVLPLSHQVWSWALISTVSVFLAVEVTLAMWVARTLATQGFPLRRLLSTLKPSLAMASLLKPAIDQDPDIEQVAGEIRQRHSLRALFTFWLLALTVLGSAYKSKVIETVVLPAYLQPPSTFSELANSSYSIYAFFTVFNAIKSDFNSLGTSYAKSIAQRLQNADADVYYLKVLGDNNAVFAYSEGLKSWVSHLVDIYGNPLYIIAPDRGFFVTVHFVMSKHRVALYDTLNNMIARFHATGFFILWNRNWHRRAMAEGLKHARNMMGTYPVYSGKEIFVDDAVLRLSLQVLGLGVTMSVCIFLVETSVARTRALANGLMRLLRTY